MLKVVLAGIVLGAIAGGFVSFIFWGVVAFIDHNY